MPHSVPSSSSEGMAVLAFRNHRGCDRPARRGVGGATAAAGAGTPDDPHDQLRAAVWAVFGSWHNRRAREYRRLNGIPDDMGTACTVQMMVFGDLGENSGTGVCFTR